jgi:hypothetical protein
VIEQFPTYGYRHIWAILRFRDGVMVNRKAVYRILREKGWFTLELTRFRGRFMAWLLRQPRVLASRSSQETCSPVLSVVGAGCTSPR